MHEMKETKSSKNCQWGVNASKKSLHKPTATFKNMLFQISYYYLLFFPSFTTITHFLNFLSIEIVMEKYQCSYCELSDVINVFGIITMLVFCLLLFGVSFLFFLLLKSLKILSIVMINLFVNSRMELMYWLFSLSSWSYFSLWIGKFLLHVVNLTLLEINKLGQ
jgi:hypothetical protein